MLIFTFNEKEVSICSWLQKYTTLQTHQCRVLGCFVGCSESLKHVCRDPTINCRSCSRVHGPLARILEASRGTTDRCHSCP